MTQDVKAITLNLQLIEVVAHWHSVHARVDCTVVLHVEDLYTFQRFESFSGIYFD